MQEKIFLTTITAYKTQLQTQLNSLEKRLNKPVPKGNIRLVKKGNSVKFYFISKECPKGKYIRIKKRDSAMQIIQRQYDKLVYRALQKRIHSLDRLIAQFHKPIDSLYTRLSPTRQQFIIPINMTDQQYIVYWLELHKPTTRNTFETENAFITNNQESVRSKSELIIANNLQLTGIPYIYEATNTINGKTIFPDFTCLNMKNRDTIIWEHFGMMDNPEYSYHAIRKITEYQNAGFILGKDLILTMESTEHPLSTSTVKKIIQQYLQN